MLVQNSSKSYLGRNAMIVQETFIKYFDIKLPGNHSYHINNSRPQKWSELQVLRYNIEIVFFCSVVLDRTHTKFKLLSKSYNSSRTLDSLLEFMVSNPSGGEVFLLSFFFHLIQNPCKQEN